MSTPASARVTAVCVVHEILPDSFGSVATTAIDKRPVTGPVRAEPLGLSGDTQCDTESHGGPDQAIYAYADEDADWWAERLQREIPPGLFGENLRTAGVDVTGAEIGEQWRIGDGVLVEVAGPRIPCQTFAGRMDQPHWVKRFTDRGAPGAYLRVVVPGPISAGDLITVQHRPGHGVTLRDSFLRPDPDLMRRLLAAADGGAFRLGARMRRRAAKAAARTD
jgi:MOSC domain-containing protein YiiM